MKGAVMIMVFVLWVSPVLCGDEWGIIKEADVLVNIRADRSEKSRITCRLKPGYRVKVDFLDRNWWAAFRLSETVRDEEHALGYIYAPMLKNVSGSSMRILPGDPGKVPDIKR